MINISGQGKPSVVPSCDKRRKHMPSGSSAFSTDLLHPLALRCIILRLHKAILPRPNPSPHILSTYPSGLRYTSQRMTRQRNVLELELTAVFSRYRILPLRFNFRYIVAIIVNFFTLLSMRIHYSISLVLTCLLQNHAHTRIVRVHACMHLCM